MPTQDEVNKYLTELRDSGEANMFGATPYVMRRFGLDRQNASRMTIQWMVSFDKRE